jgi:hypothetical protein
VGVVKEAVLQAVRDIALGSGRDPLKTLAASIRALDSLVMRLVTHPFAMEVVNYVSFFEDKEPTKPYDILLTKMHEPLTAMMVAQFYRMFGARYAETARAEQKFASGVYAIVETDKQTRVIVSNRAKKLAALLSPASAALRHACDKAGILDDVFRGLVEGAAKGDRKAWLDLYSECKKLKPFLRNPRHRIVGTATATHAFLIDEAGVKGSWNPIDSCYNDVFTKATAEEFGIPRFSPKPACKLLKTVNRAN